ncbi:gamma-type small acid-soluble spore protein [Brevibacillus choshinensis]|uniref:Small, acid-soluble spore protein gamma-type n=1 Tax=Brevibacillus choshinensis TaxID=54911 RepID=A0ABX7FSB5_BRECH|nr:gamma-type small acid-soluble spore protein [Brevibacillus choshinensis]QRG68152.1 gamma-type small acid-soluble spore protein [Brevibacillus choshinensis]
MPKQNKQAGMNRAQNAATEFASETNVSEVRRQNQQSAANTGAGAAGQTATEFGSETNASEVRRQNQQSAARSAGQAGQATE